MAQQKFTIDAQIEEVISAIEDYPYLTVKKSKADFRISRLRSALATLRWVKKNADELRKAAA